MSDENPTVICKHGSLCFFNNDIFIGCNGCRVKGKLGLLKLRYETWKISNTRVLPNSSNMSKEINPFNKSSLLPRSPPAITSGGNGEQSLPMETSDKKEDPMMEFLKQQNRELQEQNKNLITEVSKLNAQITKLTADIGKLANGSKTLQRPEPSVNYKQQKVDKVINNNFANKKATKLFNGNADKADKGDKTKGHSNGGKFKILSTDVETTDDEFSSGEWAGYNSDPEFQTKRNAAHKTAAKENKKKRKRNQDSDGSTGQSSSNTEGVDSNPKTPAPASGETANKVFSAGKKILPPPPIKVIGVDDFLKLTALLQKKNVKREDFVIRFISTDVWKVNPKNDETAKSILETLKEENDENSKIQFYTHENKNLRDIKVICKGLHPTIPNEEIIEDLKSKGFAINKVTCLMKRVPIIEDKSKKSKNLGQQTLDEMVVDQDKNTIAEANKEATPSGSAQDKTNNTDPTDTNLLFIEDKDYKAKTKLVHIPVHQLDFNHEEDIEKIYQIKGICNMVVKIEPIRVHADKIIQCRRCQSFGHTANSCGKQPRCVKCASKHITQNCPFAKRILNPRCANCGTIGHPANYRGCPFAKEMQAERINAIKKKIKENPKISGNFPRLPTKGKGKNQETKVSTQQQGRSYAQTVINEPKASPSQDDVTKQFLKTIESQRVMIEKLNERLARFEELFFVDQDG